MTPCRFEWVDLDRVEHGCTRSDQRHLVNHRCGCGATLSVFALGPRGTAVGQTRVCGSES